MRFTTLTSAIPAIVALCALSGASVSAMDNDNASTRDKNVKALENVPAKVKDTLLKESQGREIRDVDQVTEDGHTVYRAKIQRDGKDLKIGVDADGSIVSRNDGMKADDGVKGVRNDSDRDVRDASRDAARDGKRSTDDAKDKANHETRKAKDEADRDARKADREGDRAKDKADRELTKDKATAEAKAEKAKDDAENQKREGRREMDEHGARTGAVTIDQVPAAVKATLEREANGLPIGDIDRDTEDGRTVYKARIKVQNGQDHKLKVAEDGQLVSKKN